MKGHTTFFSHFLVFLKIKISEISLGWIKHRTYVDIVSEKKTKTKTIHSRKMIYSYEIDNR